MGEAEQPEAATLTLADLPAPLLVFIDGEVDEANPAACEILHCEASALEGVGLASQLVEDSAAELAAALASPDPTRLMLRRRTDTIAQEFYEARLSPVGSDTVLVTLQDFTEQYRLDSALAALGNSTFGLDEGASMSWRPFRNAERLGVANEDVIGQNVLEWIHPDELPRVLELFSQLIANPGQSTTELVRTRQPYIPSGWVITRLTAVNQLENPALPVVVVRSEEAQPVDHIDDLSRTTGRFSSLAEVAPVGIVVTDRESSLLYSNELARELLGLEDEIVGRTDWANAVRTDWAGRLADILSDALHERRKGSMVSAFGPEDSPARWVRIDAVPQLDETGEVFGVIATLADVTAETETSRALEEARQRLWHLANHDALTGLPNRALFADRLDQALAQSRRSGIPIALLYCDLDGFKQVNDAGGHEVGDAVLIECARRLREVARAAETVCRWGGDEFLVLCNVIEGESVPTGLADRLIRSLDQPIEIEGDSYQVGLSVGIAKARGGEIDGDELVRRADGALYAAKSAGRGRYELA